MGTARFRNNGEEKLCTGFLHKGNPTWLHIDQFPIHKSGKRIGKPMGECWDCWRSRRGLNPQNGWVKPHEAWPIFNRLISIAGSKKAAAEMLGRPYWFFSRKNENFRGTVVREAEQLVAHLEKNTGKARNGEAEICDPEPFGSILRKFVEDWNQERAPDQQEAWASNRVVMSAMEYLSEKTEIHYRRIGALKANEVERIPFSQVDALLQAMNLTHYLYDGTIQVKPNPRWSMESYLAYMRERGCI